MRQELALQRVWTKREFAVIATAGAWTLYLALVAVRLSVLGLSNMREVALRHCLTAAIGAILTAALFWLLSRLERRPPLVQIGAALLLAAPAAAALAVANYDVMFVFAPSDVWSVAERAGNNLPRVFVQTIAENEFLFTALAFLYIAVASVIDSRDALQRATVAESQAQKAQLQALRYQLDPHFLFNALNTISALVMEGEAEKAEQALASLSAVLRTTLASDALVDTTLRQEFRLHETYLGIEGLRFGARLQVALELPEELADVPIPPLLLQPLVENVIKHAVGVSETPIHMSVRARGANEQVVVTVEDNGPGSQGAGFGLGLRNVAERLALRFGEGATFQNGPLADGGYRAVLSFPLKRPLPE
ncbi:sensor histidine kinase [Sphingomonas echinoides]|jgi:two-component system LytT family sensor kinase|uniref:sensor histidine kinase n=1 Tax=Sphingomonas echinoides TaxID=59803 RepID=UPI003EEAB0D3